MPSLQQPPDASNRDRAQAHPAARLVDHVWGLLSGKPIVPVRDKPVGCHITYHRTSERRQRAA